MAGDKKVDKAAEKGTAAKENTAHQSKDVTGAGKGAKAAGPNKENLNTSANTDRKPTANDASGSIRAKRNWKRIKPKDLLRANGVSKPDLRRADSLNVPRGDQEGRDSPRSQNSDSADSRRGSNRSLDSKFSAIDFSKIQAAQGNQAEDDGDDKQKSQVTSDSYLQSAIPYLPQWLAILCFLMNIFIPGTGTIVSGASVYCCGKTRVQTKDDAKATTMCVNLFVGLAQLFTVTFMLVGWFWSFVWGIYMLILAVQYRREEKARQEKLIQAKALSAFGPQVRPWTLRT